jgi:RNA polymerase sigma-70 factor (ECF subfamily)
MNRGAPGNDRQRRFTLICEPLRADLFRFALWLSRSRSVAEDVVQETMLRAWKSLDSLKDDAAARHWLLTIARREHARLYERKRHETVNIDELVSAEVPALAGKAENDAEADQLRDVRRAIFTLEPEYREPLVLQVLLGYSTEEIAQHMNLNQGAVLTRLFRARNQLRERLGLGPDESAPKEASREAGRESGSENTQDAPAVARVANIREQKS